MWFWDSRIGATCTCTAHRATCTHEQGERSFHLQDKHVDAFTDKVGGYLNSVVGLLLRHNKAEIRTLGARLLAQFEKVQVSLPELTPVYTIYYGVAVFGKLFKSEAELA